MIVAKEERSIVKRPPSVTIVSCLFAAASFTGLVFHLADFHRPLQYDLVWICLIRLIGVVSGLYMLRGSNWARWLTVAWMAFHVILSIFHSVSQFVVHSLLLAILGFFLFRRPAAEYFRSAGNIKEQTE